MEYNICLYMTQDVQLKKKSKAPPIAQFVNAAHDIKPWEKERSCICEHTINLFQEEKLFYN